MTPKISRYLLVALAVITFAYVLPAIYNTLFDARINMPYTTYSTTKKEYYAANWADGKSVFTDRMGKQYSQQEFLDNTVIENYYFHLSKGTFPDSLNGQKLYPQQLQKESFNAWVEPELLNVPDYAINPLFESQPEFGLSFSKDYFRFNSRMEFIDAKSNKVNESKSRQFTEALNKEGFSYPAKIIAGMPTLMKKREDGWFITDSKEQLFHLLMVKGAPVIRKIALPSGMQLRHIICNDYDANEFFAILITTDNRLFVLNRKDYSTTQMPVEGYNAKNMSMIISGNLFNKTVAVKSDRGLQLTTFNREYKVIDKHFMPVAQKSEMAIGKVSAAIFPFQLLLSSPYDSFISFHLKDSDSWTFLILNLMLVIATVILMRKEGKQLSRSIPDLVIVAITGIFGFLAVHIIPNKQY